MRLRGRSAWIATVVLSVSLLGSTGVLAQSRPEIDSLLDEGVSLFRQGDLDGAQAKFEKALSLDITSDEALQFIEKVGYAQLIRMMRTQGLTNVLSRYEEMVSVQTRRRARDEEKIRQTLAEYFATDDVGKETSLRYSMTNEYGFYLCPGLVERLGSPELDTRVRAIVALKQIGEDAVIPLCVASHTDDSAATIAIIAALKAIKSPAAVPTLKRLAETSADSIVQQEALAAVRKLDASRASRTAYDLLLEHAERFYLSSRYLNRTHHDPVIWELNDGVLGYRPVPSWALNELRAEQVIDDAMSQPGEGKEAAILYCSNNIAQYSEYLAVRELAQDEATLNELNSEETQTRMNRVRNRSHMLSDTIVEGALARAMADGRPLVAIGAIDVVRERWPAGQRASSVPPVLVAAQSYPHRGVRFAASETIAYRNPKSRFGGSDKVLPNLTEGLIEAGGRLALTVFSNQEDELNAREKLRMSNVAVFNETDGFHALHRAISFPHDLIVLGTDITNIATADIIARLRADHRTRDVPILVIADDTRLTDAKTTYENPEAGVQVLNYSIEGLRLRDEILEPLFASEDDVRSRDVMIAARAAEAIGFLATHNGGRDTVFDLSQCDRALVEVLENRKDAVRIPACRAIAVLGLKSSEPGLIEILRQGDSNSVELRVAALDALGKINRGSGSDNPQVIDVIKTALESGQAELMRSAANAAGNAGLRPAIFKGD